VPGIIFLSETFYPGWEPLDKKHKLIKVFGAFTGIVVPETGTGEIVLQFKPAKFRVGAMISGVLLGGLALLALVTGLKSRFQKPRS
jgi:uncharacterized membrane protein YfhO